MRRELLEEILIGLAVLMGIVSAIVADAAGVPALKWLGIGMVVSGAVAIAVKRRRCVFHGVAIGNGPCGQARML